METSIKREDIVDEINKIPDNLLDEVYSYLQYLKFKKNKKDFIQTDVASQSVLSKDWLRPEEDKAWKDL